MIPQFTIDTSHIDAALYYLKVNFANNVSYISDKYILFYYNEIELEEEETKKELNQTMGGINIPLKNSIIGDQIKKITIKRKSDSSSTAETVITDYGLSVETQKTIMLTFNDILVDDNYTITIYDNGNDDRMLYYNIYYKGDT